MRRMTQAQYSAIVARQRQLQQSRNKEIVETKPNNELNNTVNRNDNAVNAINELNKKVAEREQLDDDLKKDNAHTQPSMPPSAVPTNFQVKPSTTSQTRLPVMSSKNVAENIRQNINMKKNMTNDEIEAGNELHSNYDKLENIKVEVIEKDKESNPAPTPKNDVVTAAAVKNFEMIFNNTNTLMEKYKSHVTLIEKQNENLTTTYERKLRSNEVTIENLTKTVNELSGVIKELTDKIKILTPESEKQVSESTDDHKKEEQNSDEQANKDEEVDEKNKNVEEMDNSKKTNDESNDEGNDDGNNEGNDEGNDAGNDGNNEGNDDSNDENEENDEEN